MPEQITSIPDEVEYIRPVPAALRHVGRQSADELKVIDTSFKDRRYETVVAVKYCEQV